RPHGSHDRPLLDSDRRVLGGRLADRGESDTRDIIAAAHERPSRNRKAGFVEKSIDQILVKAERSRATRVSRVGNSEKLENRNDHRLEFRDSIDSLAKIEYEIEFRATHA